MILLENERALIRAMRKLGEQLIAWRRDDRARTILSRKDLKLQADKWAHECLTEAISALWPGVSIISEEDASHEARRPETYWLIDPIDGTASWLDGFSGFVTQAALIEADVPVAGYVFAPALDRFYLGLHGRGAWVNDDRLEVQQPREDVVLVDNTPTPHGIVVPMMQRLMATGYVESGSLGLKCCLVGDGTADLFVKDVVVRDWDMAPAAAILAEIGAVLVTADNRPYRFCGGWEKRDGIIAARSTELAASASEAYRAIKQGDPT